ncbi:protoporphyrinogen oxidase [Stieleria sp. JC731]|uniref:protoporphyrinogen oxidase n=1 Tax=Pirellulaceae TaxID=2691357 RepID=UPI001E4C0EA7|nr:protoporphyrinogen oxidase [Stieleria sp. JC731]MCC9599234.1 protoporphyrinogen oxidase [Stieleria sp. JC731]
MMPKKVAVIGGGISGLTTAFYLRQLRPDSQFTLFESSPRLGGVIGTEVVDVSEGRFVIDHGADMFATDPPAAMQLCKDLGIDGQLIIPDAKRAGAMVVHQGKIAPIPEGFVLMRATKPWQILMTPILSPLAKLRFLKERFVAAQPELSPDSDGDLSVAQFVRHRLGQQALERLVEPLVAGIYTADVEKLSLKATMGPIVAMVQKHGSLAKATLSRRRENEDSTERNSAGARYQRFRGLPNGMGQLIETLVDRVGSDRISVNQTVTQLNFDGQQWTVAVSDKDGHVTSEVFDEVVLATPAGVSARLLASAKASSDDSVRQACQTAGDGLGSIQCASAAIVVLCIAKKHLRSLPEKFGIVVPTIENRSLLAVSFASHKYPIRCPEDHVIARAFFGGAMRAEDLQKTDQQLISLARQELGELIGLQGPETIAKVVRWNNAMPQYHVGHQAKADAIETAIDQIPHLHLATNALRGVGIAPLVATAKKAALAAG